MSTVHAALELIESISTAVDSNTHCALEYSLTLKRLFDTVNHGLLVKKLFFYGIRGTAHAWLNNYLTNRNQYVIADDHSSGMRLITCGVPQGSVLGPVLFLLYINVSNLLKFVLFADDTNIFVLPPVYMTYKTLSTGSWINLLCGSLLIDYHYIWGKQITCCSAVHRLIMS